MVALFVLGQHYEVPAGLVDALRLEFFVAAAGHIHFATEDGLEIGHGPLARNLSLAVGDELFGRLPRVRIFPLLVRHRRIGTVLQRGEFFLRLLQRTLGLPRHFLGIVEEFLDAHHVAMVGHCHSAHAVAHSLVYELRDGCLTVENRVLCMNMEMNKVLHKILILG